MFMFEMIIKMFLFLYSNHRPAKKAGASIDCLDDDVKEEKFRVESEDSMSNDVLRVTDLSKVTNTQFLSK